MQLQEQETFTISGPQLTVLGAAESRLPAPARKKPAAALFLAALALVSVFGLGGLLLMPVLAVTGGPILHSGGNLAVAAYMALIPMFLGYVLFGRGLATVPASTATTVTLTEPAVATLLAVVVVGERLGPLGWAGLLVLAAVLALLALAPPAAAPRPVGVGTSGPAVARCRRY